MYVKQIDSFLCKKRDIPKYINEELALCLRIWDEKERKGLPLAPLGYAHHPNLWNLIIDTVDRVKGEIKNWQRDR